MAVSSAGLGPEELFRIVKLGGPLRRRTLQSLGNLKITNNEQKKRRVGREGARRTRAVRISMSRV